MNLFKASNQWAERPMDETFWGIEDALATAKDMYDKARTSIVPYGNLRVEASDGALRLVGSTGIPAYPTFSATNQLCQRAKVPHSFISRQPATLAAQNINWGLKEYKGDEDDNAVLLFHNNDRLVLRATTSEMYERFWNADLLARMRDILPHGWVVPPARPSPARSGDPRIRPATKEDLVTSGGMMGLSVNEGDLIAPAGVYLSDKDLFVFLWNNNTIEGPSGPLHRFSVWWNNEIGTGSWGVLYGLADAVCGNHIIWHAQDVKELRFRHVGNRHIGEGMTRVRITLKEYSNASANEEEGLLKRAANMKLGATKEEVMDAVFMYAKKGRIDIPQKAVGQAYDIAEQRDRYGAPNTPWAIASGLTELSQKQSSYADERTRHDRAAGRVLDMAF